jgi:hypothetical protein
MLLGQPHLLLLFWWVVVGLVVFGGVVAVDQQLLQIMLRADRSHICFVLLLMYAIGVAHTFTRTLFLSTELGLAATLADRLRAGTLNAHALQSREAAQAAGLKAGFVVEYLSDLRTATPVAAGEPGSDLLDAYATRLRGAHEFSAASQHLAGVPAWLDRAHGGVGDNSARHVRVQHGATFSVPRASANKGVMA